MSNKNRPGIYRFLISISLFSNTIVPSEAMELTLKSLISTQESLLDSSLSEEIKVLIIVGLDLLDGSVKTAKDVFTPRLTKNMTDPISMIIAIRIVT